VKMKFERSGNIALHVSDIESAYEFYREVIDLPLERKGDSGAMCQLRSGLFYVAENAEWQGLVEEYYVDDVELAKQHLLEKGCTVIHWEGKGKDCYMRDPFGMMFNLWQRERGE